MTAVDALFAVIRSEAQASGYVLERHGKLVAVKLAALPASRWAAVAELAGIPAPDETTRRLALQRVSAAGGDWCFEGHFRCHREACGEAESFAREAACSERRRLEQLEIDGRAA